MTNAPTQTLCPLREPSRAALLEALDDERSAEALYQAIIARHGPIRPFVNIIESERRHQARLLELFQRYQLPVPPAQPRNVELAPTLEQECRRAVAAERDNIAMYDRLLDAVREPDIRRVFANLRAASRDNHLPAFERCARRQRGRRR
jgi:hypothetical protein